jgi:uridine kinase
MLRPGTALRRQEYTVAQRPFIVSIVGPSAAGKSQLARRTAAELGDDLASRVPADDFFVPRPVDQPLGDFLRQPLRYDWALLAQCLALPVGTAVTTPNADFTTFQRIADSGGRPFTIRQVMIVDAMVAFPNADLLVRLDVPDDVRRERLRERDVRWNSNVLANWEHLTVTWRMALATLAEMRSPDLALDGERPLDVNAGTVAELVRSRLAAP